MKFIAIGARTKLRVLLSGFCTQAGFGTVLEVFWDYWLITGWNKSFSDYFSISSAVLKNRWSFITLYGVKRNSQRWSEFGRSWRPWSWCMLKLKAWKVKSDNLSFYIHFVKKGISPVKFKQHFTIFLFLPLEKKVKISNKINAEVQRILYFKRKFPSIWSL